jgi:hypothetical protein
MPLNILFRDKVVLLKNQDILGRGMQKTRNNGLHLTNRMKQMKIRGGVIPVRRVEQRTPYTIGGRINRRPIQFMP